MGPAAALMGPSDPCPATVVKHEMPATGPQSPPALPFRALLGEDVAFPGNQHFAFLSPRLNPKP